MIMENKTLNVKLLISYSFYFFYLQFLKERRASTKISFRMIHTLCCVVFSESLIPAPSILARPGILICIDPRALDLGLNDGFFLRHKRDVQRENTK